MKVIFELMMSREKLFQTIPDIPLVLVTNVREKNAQLAERWFRALSHNMEVEEKAERLRVRKCADVGRKQEAIRALEVLLEYGEYKPEGRQASLDEVTEDDSGPEGCSENDKEGESEMGGLAG